MTVTFSPPVPPSPPTGKKTSFRIRKVPFGEGAVQVFKDGLNSVMVSYDLNWSNLTASQAGAIEAFFVARGGYETFLYTVPGDVERTYRSGQIARSWSDSGVLSSITVSIEEVF